MDVITEIQRLALLNKFKTSLSENKKTLYFKNEKYILIVSVDIDIYYTYLLTSDLSSYKFFKDIDVETVAYVIDSSNNIIPFESYEELMNYLSPYLRRYPLTYTNGYRSC